MGGDGGNAKGTVGVTPPGGQADHGDYGSTWGGWEVGISPGGGGTVSRMNKPHNGVN